MPNGIIMVRWDDKLGVVIEGIYPKTLKISEDHVMRIFTTHAMGGGESGFLSMSIENLNIASYYTGLPEEGKSQYYVALMLRDDENSDIFEEPLIETSPLLILHVKDKNFDQFFKKQFEDIIKLTEMTEEQRYAMIHRDRRRILILLKLGLGAIPKDNLRKWVSDQIGEEVLDIDAILSPLTKTEMIKELSVETMDGSRKKCIFLIKDVFSMRSPVEKFYKMAKDGKAPSDMKQVLEIYKENVDQFFKDYKFGDADSKQIAEIASDPSQYNLITILRNNYIEVNQLPDIFEKSIEQINEYINDLKRYNIIDEIKDKRGNTWIFLRTDIIFPTFFPEYIVDSIRRRWMEKDITQNLALSHLELLKSVYRGEEEEFIEGFEGPRVQVEEEISLSKAPTKLPKVSAPGAPVVAAPTKTLSDEEIFQFVEQVSYLRKEAKMDLDNKDRESAYNKLQEAISITNTLIAAGAVGQEKRLEKLIQVADSVKKLLEKETGKKFKETPITPTPATPRFPTMPSMSEPVATLSSVDQQKFLREDRDNAIASADSALTGGEFNDAVRYLEKAAELSEKMGEADKARDITKMANDIKKKLEKLQ
ncbi:MAG TPA: hypothetical protein VMV49_16160 [Candidatus Deferrimicrobium sp.]|nr:hypothetical protein [Candidatus Deferrimicrobium sp.]